MKAQPAGPFPPLHGTFVKSEEFLLHVNPESERREERQRFTFKPQAMINTVRKRKFELFQNMSPGFNGEKKN